jgi:hypothetical protein
MRASDPVTFRSVNGQVTESEPDPRVDANNPLYPGLNFVVSYSAEGKGRLKFRD